MLRPHLAAALASTVIFLLQSEVGAQDLVLEMTTKLGAEKTVKVASVNLSDPGDPAAGFNALDGVPSRIAHLFPKTLMEGDTKCLVLSPSPAQHYYPGLVVAIPWHAIKGVGSDKGVSIVTCLDGATFTGTILTEVTGKDKDKHHLASCRKMAVKELPRKDLRPDGAKNADGARPTAKCTIHFNKLAQSFEARSIGLRQSSEISGKFQMRTDLEVISGNFAELTRVVVKGGATGPIAIAVRAPKGSETQGKLALARGHASLILHGTNECVCILHMWDVLLPNHASYAVDIQASKADERLPVEFGKFIDGKANK